MVSTGGVVSIGGAVNNFQRGGQRLPARWSTITSVLTNGTSDVSAMVLRCMQLGKYRCPHIPEVWCLRQAVSSDERLANHA
jgi:hypothetical protein